MDGQSSRWTLRFKDAEWEETFVQDRESFLRRNVTIASLVLILASLSTIVWKWLYQATGHEQHEILLYGATVLHALQLCIILACVTYMHWSHGRIHHRLGISAAELALVVGLLLCILLNTLVDDHILARIVRVDLELCREGEDPYIPDSETLTFLIVFLLVPHLFLPIRWHLLWPCELQAIISFGIDEFALKGAQDFHPLVTTGGFIIIALITTLGKRHSEIFEREAFANIRHEQSKRGKAEDKLHTLYGKRRSVYKVLSNAGHRRKDELAEALTVLAGTGNVEHWLLKESVVEITGEAEMLTGALNWTLKHGKLHGTPVLVKMPMGGTMDMIQRAVPELQAEIRNLRRMRHPNIVHFHGAFVSPSTCMLGVVLEDVIGIPLYTFAMGSIAERPSFDRRRVVLDLCSAVRHMHSLRPPVAHGRLEASSVVVELNMSGPRAKIMNLGTARVASGTTGMGPTTSKDSWSLMRFSRAPSSDASPMQVLPSLADDLVALSTLLMFTMLGIPEPWNSDLEAWKKTPWLRRFISICERCCDQVQQRFTIENLHTELQAWKVPERLAKSAVTNGTVSKPSQASTQASVCDALAPSSLDITEIGAKKIGTSRDGGRLFEEPLRSPTAMPGNVQTGLLRPNIPTSPAPQSPLLQSPRSPQSPMIPESLPGLPSPQPTVHAIAPESKLTTSHWESKSGPLAWATTCSCKGSGTHWIGLVCGACS